MQLEVWRAKKMGKPMERTTHGHYIQITPSVLPHLLNGDKSSDPRGILDNNWKQRKPGTTNFMLSYSFACPDWRWLPWSLNTTQDQYCLSFWQIYVSEEVEIWNCSWIVSGKEQARIQSAFREGNQENSFTEKPRFPVASEAGHFMMTNTRIPILDSTRAS